MGRFGVYAREMASRDVEGFGKAKTTWGRLFVYMADKTVTGDRLPELEAEWLSEWMAAEKLEDPASVVVVQITQSQVAREVFGGHPESVRRAIEGLEKRGFLKLIRRGIKGHGSLYFRGLIDTDEKVSKSCENVSLSAFECTHGFEECTHGFEECTHNEKHVNCENAPIFNLFKPYSTRERQAGEAREEKRRCPQCGSEDVAPSYYSSLLECRGCGGCFPSGGRRGKAAAAS